MRIAEAEIIDRYGRFTRRNAAVQVGAGVYRACPDRAYGFDEQAVAWLTCIEVMFRRFKHVRVMGNEVELGGFDLHNQELVAVCRQGKRKARVSLDSVEFPELTPIDARWLTAWKRFSACS